jgi:hypothetical protein
MTRLGDGWSAARRRARGLRAAAAAIGALALALGAPAAASAAPDALAVTATITVGTQPWGVAIKPMTGTVYTDDNSGTTASVISR